jgi:hypothetical protein
METFDLLWTASIEEIKKGYIQKGDCFACLLCEKEFEKGIIYPEEGVFYEAERYMRFHIEKAHHSVFDTLIQMDKDLTGLSDHQKKLLQLFYQGKSDNEIRKEMEIGSTSTIRNHRFVLKKKERQAKVFLTLMELVKQKDQHQSANLDFPEKAESVDEYEKIISRNFSEGPGGPLKTLNLKEKHKLVVLREIAKHFKNKKTYTEKEINDILKAIYEDNVILRRYLIEYGFLDRTPDGSRYWLIRDSERGREESMDRKKEIKRLYKETEPEAGVYQIKNTINQKILIASSLNLKTINGKEFQLKSGTHKNRELQKEWNEFGKEAFVFEVLEILKPKKDGYFDAKDELEKLEEKWLEKLQPFGERGYNRKEL